MKQGIPLNLAKFTDKLLPQLIHYPEFITIILYNNTPLSSLDILTKFTIVFCPRGML